MTGKPSDKPPSTSEREPMPDEHLLKPNKALEWRRNRAWIWFAVIVAAIYFLSHRGLGSLLLN